MANRFVRSSKFRHVFGTAAKPDKCYLGIKISKAPFESNMCAVNSKYVAVVLEAQGGGSFIVLDSEKVSCSLHNLCLPSLLIFPIASEYSSRPPCVRSLYFSVCNEYMIGGWYCVDKLFNLFPVFVQFGRVDLEHPKVTGHKGQVMDIQWNPFDDNIIASSSEDATVMIWEIPEGGLKEGMNEPKTTLEAHERKCAHIQWHPTAKNVIASSGYDNIIHIWDIDNPDSPIISLDSFFEDTIYSFDWNMDGSLIAATSKDKKITVIDPRKNEVVSKGSGHQGGKPSRVVFCGSTGKLFTTGHSRTSERQYALWDPVRLDLSLIYFTLCLNVIYAMLLLLFLLIFTYAERFV